MPRHVVVDGSNLATEGRALPSLKQLNEAVLAFIEENPDDIVTVVVDATFGHRIDPREVPEFDAAVENNELVAPPAGAVGRGDAFVLTIANKVNATIISNDSYQEFHGQYDWLFDDGRLIGGKPVPNVGWVFVPRVPVRGPVSRRATKDANKVDKTAGREPRKAARPSKEASRPMPVPTAPPPAVKHKAPAEKVAEKSPSKPAAKTEAPTASRQHLVNELLPFLGFVERHPVGSTVRGVVESYSSHGAYVALGDARGYVPLRLMADPPPRSARETMKLASEVDLVVVSFNPTRRSIDLCVPGMEPPEVRALAEAKARSTPAKRSRKKAPAEAPAAPSPAEAKPVKRSRAKAGPAPDATLAAVPEAVPAKRTRKKAAAAESSTEPPVKQARKRARAAPDARPAKRTPRKAAAS
jgi:Zc3h12a-like Ribonuclease NYN domain/S1 RNA binding domain